MTDFNVAPGQTQPTGTQNNNNGTITGNASAAFGIGGGTLDVAGDWNGGSADVVGGTLEIDHDFNGTNATLDDATLLIATHDANNAAVDLQGVDRIILSSKIAASSGLEGIVINGFSYGDRIELIGATSGGSGTPSLAGGILSFNIGGTSYQASVGLAPGAPDAFEYGYDSDSGYYYVGLASGPPSVSITSPAESDASTSRTISGTVTANGAATVAGTTVTLSEGGTALGHATVASDGTFSAQVTLTGQGSHDIVASDTDSLGNTGTSAAVTETVTPPPAPPTVTITSPAESDAGTSRTISGTVTANGAATVAGTTVTLSEGGAALGHATVASDGTFSAQVTLTGQGSHDIVASDTDSLGNTGTSAAVTETVTAAPDPQPVGTAPPGPAASGPGTGAPAGTPAGGSPTPSASDPKPSSIAAGSDGRSPSGTPPAPGPSVPTPAGRTTADDPGPPGPSTAGGPQFPAPSVAFDASASVRGATAHLTGTVSPTSGSGIAGIEIFEGTTDLGAATMKGDGTWGFDLRGDGTYQDGLRAVATDGAGATATAQSPNSFLYTGGSYPGYDFVVDASDPDSGDYTGSTYFKRNGAVYLHTSYTGLENGGSRVQGTGGSYFDDKDFTSYVDSYDAGGDLVKWMKASADGSHRIDVTGDGQIVRMTGADTVWDEGSGTRFVFNPGVGQETVYGFTTSGAGHDVISLPAADRGSLADVLLSARSDGQGGTTLNMGGGDTIDLVGVAVDDLRAHAADFKIRAR